MHVRLIKLRSRGKKLPAEVLRSVAYLEGNLELVMYQTNTRSYSYAKVTKQYSGGRIDNLCDLYEPKLISIDGDCLLFDGVEEDKQSGEVHFQQWRCFTG